MAYKFSMEELKGGKVYSGRMHEDGDLGDDYNWCCTVHIVGMVANLYGTLTAPTYRQSVAIFRALLAEGAQVCRWEVKGGAKPGMRELDLTTHKGVMRERKASR